jgi:hypothetical protein
MAIDRETLAALIYASSHNTFWDEEKLRSLTNSCDPDEAFQWADDFFREAKRQRLALHAATTHPEPPKECDHQSITTTYTDDLKRILSKKCAVCNEQLHIPGRPKTEPAPKREARPKTNIAHAGCVL